MENTTLYVNRGAGKKPAMMASREFDAMASAISKAALIDALWCACQLGTNETDGEIEAQAARNIRLALMGRGDKVPSSVVAAADRRIDSDPIGDD